MASGPAIGSTIALYYPLEVMFYASSISAILSVMILSGMKETLPQPERFRWSLLRLSKNEIFEPRVIAPCIVLLLTTFSFGVVLTIAPDLSDHLGIRNKGLFFTCFTIASVAIRFFVGKASDRYGRITLLKIAAFTLTIGMLLLGLANSITTLIIAGIVFGLAAGMNTPTAFAWAIDLSHEKHRGRGMATIYISLEIGIGLGALVSGWIYGNDPSMFFYTFFSGAVLGLLALLYLQFGIKKREKKVKAA
jgi:MFS family permease